jgi:hypothetical protein
LKGNTVLIKRIMWQIVPAVLGLVFMVFFVLFRWFFQSLSPLGQNIIAPFWPILTIGFEVGVKYALHHGNNPDAVPLAAFFFDQLGSMCGNLLFIEADDFGTLTGILFVDVLENLYLTINALNLIDPDAKDRRETKIVISMERQLEAARDTSLSIVKAAKHTSLSMVEGTAHQINRTSIALKDQFHERCLPTIAKGGPSNDLVVLDPDMEVEIFDAAVDDVLPTASTKSNPNDARHSLQRGKSMRNASENELNFSKGLHMLLSLCISELSEIGTSLWSMILLGILYYGVNRNFFTGMKEHELDDSGFKMTMQMSGINAVAEIVLTAVLMYYIYYRTGINAVNMALCYAERNNLLVIGLCWSVSIPILATCFFLDHFGVDPQFVYSTFRNGDYDGGG